MKSTLKSQLESYKRDNTENSKEAMLSTMDSIFNSMTNYDISTLSSIEAAKKALTSNETNKNEIIQTVESVISNLS